MLKNHLRWARIKVMGDGSKVPREILLESDGYLFKIPIWCELPATVLAALSKEEEDEDNSLLGNRGSPYPSVNSGDLLEKGFKLVANLEGHVGSSKGGEGSKIRAHVLVTCDQIPMPAIEILGPKQSVSLGTRQAYPSLKLCCKGPNQLAHYEITNDPFLIEIQAISTKRKENRRGNRERLCRQSRRN